MSRRSKNPAQAAEAIAALKNLPPDPFEYVALVDELSRELKNGLPKPTEDWITRQLAHTDDPFVRHFVMSRMKQSPKLECANISSLVKSKNIEMTLASCRSSGALDEDSGIVKDFIASQGILPSEFSEHQWAQSFECAVLREDYENARKIWLERHKFLNVPVSMPMLARFMILAGIHEDANILKRIFDGINFDLPVTSPTFAAAVNCMPNLEEAIDAVIQYSNSIQGGILLSDFIAFSDRLGTHILDIIPMLTQSNTELGNFLLQGSYRKYTSQLVFHFYRRISRSCPGFEPDAVTAQILANAAFRLGNSKVLVYEIYQEFKHLPLDRKFFETSLLCQTSGNGFNTTSYASAEMTRRRIPIRRHIQRMMFAKFQKGGTTSDLVELAQPNFGEKHKTFNKDLALKESGNASQAEMNVGVFLHGKNQTADPVETLQSMLDYDRHREEYSMKKSQEISAA